MTTLNGCSCAEVRALKEMSPDWKCICCSGRRASGLHCKQCGIGIFKEEAEKKSSFCTECYYDE